MTSATPRVNAKELRPLRDLTGPAQITGDAVVLDVPPAGLPVRALASVIDGICWGLALFALSWLVDHTLGEAGVSDAALAGWAIACVAGAFVVLPATVETMTMGRSLGKRLMGLRVVRTDGGAIAFRHALGRALVGFIEIWMCLGVIAFITGALTQRSRRLGDLAAGTYVVRESRKLLVPPPAQMPGQLAGWANVATVAPLPPALAAQLSDVARHRFAANSPAYRSVVTGTLGAVLPYVTPAPPPGHDPLAVLVAVAVLRRDADLRRLERDERRRTRMLRP